MVCRNICERYPKTQVNYIAGGKYCAKCECYIFTQNMFCECCGMRLRASPRIYKEKVRAKKKLIAHLVESHAAISS